MKPKLDVFKSLVRQICTKESDAKARGIVYPKIVNNDIGRIEVCSYKNDRPNEVFHQTDIIVLAEAMEVSCWMGIKEVKGVNCVVAHFF